MSTVYLHWIPCRPRVLYEYNEQTLYTDDPVTLVQQPKVAFSQAFYYKALAQAYRSLVFITNMTCFG